MNPVMMQLNHIVDHMDYRTYRRTKAMLVLIGENEMDSLIKHVGKIVKADSYKQVVEKVKGGITAQTNQIMD